MVVNWSPMWYFPTMGNETTNAAVAYLSLDQKGRATLPEAVRRSLSLRPDDFVLLERTDRGAYELVPAALVPRDQLWFHHPQMQRRIREAEADLVAGRVEKTRSAKAAQALLDARKGKPRRSPQ